MLVNAIERRGKCLLVSSSLVVGFNKNSGDDSLLGYTNGSEVCTASIVTAIHHSGDGDSTHI
jgi:hypothetical protein